MRTLVNQDGKSIYDIFIQNQSRQQAETGYEVSGD